MATLSPLAIRDRLGRERWGPPNEHGPDGWYFLTESRASSIIVTVAVHDDVEWIHASIAHASWMPSYDDLCLLHRAVFTDGYAYQLFVPPDRHVNIHPWALHLWGRLDGRNVLPDFGKHGTI